MLEKNTCKTVVFGNFTAFIYQNNVYENILPVIILLYKGKNVLINKYISNCICIDKDCVELQIFNEKDTSYDFFWIDCENNESIKITTEESGLVKIYEDQVKLEIQDSGNNTNENGELYYSTHT